VPATFYIASLPFQDALQNGGYTRACRGGSVMAGLGRLLRIMPRPRLGGYGS